MQITLVIVLALLAIAIAIVIGRAYTRGRRIMTARELAATS